jgi:ribosomal protein S18 acetylase RimI-like enzyme
MVNRLPWDSDFFGMEIGSVSVTKKARFVLDSFKAESANFDLVYVFSDSVVNELDAHSWIEEKVIYQKKVVSNSYLIENIAEFDASTDSLEQLKNLVYLSGKHSRFNVDSKFPDHEFKKLYKAWMNKSLEAYEIKVFVKKENDQLAGFITLEIAGDGVVKIGLIAVNEDFQRRGIAKELVCFSENYLFEHGYTDLHVTTQSHNQSAVNFYRSRNFEKLSGTHIYHFWNK